MPEIKMLITFDTEARGVRVEGAIGDKMLAYGMLDMAREAIQETHRQQAENRVQLAPGPLAPMPAGLGG
jgi:hypothetical protein